MNIKAVVSTTRSKKQKRYFTLIIKDLQNSK